MTPMTDDWGTNRERARKRRRWTTAAIAAVAVALALPLAVFVLGIVEGFTGAHDPARAIPTRDHAGYLGIAFAMLVALVVNVRLWRGGDEVERAAIVAALATAGIVALTTLPVLSLAAEPLALRNPAMLGWGLSVATLIGMRLVQRLRG